MLEIKRATPDDAERGVDGFGPLLEQVVSQGAWSGEIRSRHRDGHLQTLWASVATVHDEQQVPTHLVTVFTDISANACSFDTLGNCPSARSGFRTITSRRE